jgi:LytR cell envelope-related transcriptional attenuator
VVAPGPGPYPVSARQPVRFRRRRPLPAVSLIVVLGVIATIVWIRTLDTTKAETDNTCEPPSPTVSISGGPPTAPATSGTLLAANALDSVEPLPPDAVKVKVLNANGKRGQASLTAAELTSDLGFATAAPPDNDPVYPAWDLTCQAQIRFGANGDAAARTLSLVVPCAELIRDARPDDTVDLALGHQFESLRPSSAARQVLRQLTELAEQPPDPSGGQQATVPTVDPSLIASARQVTC